MWLEIDIGAEKRPKKQKKIEERIRKLELKWSVVE